MRTIKAVILLALLLLHPLPAYGGDLYRIGPGPPYGYGYSGPGSYTNVPDPSWPDLHAIQQRDRYDTRPPAPAPDRARAEPDRSR